MGLLLKKGFFYKIEYFISQILTNRTSKVTIIKLSKENNIIWQIDFSYKL